MLIHLSFCEYSLNVIYDLNRQQLSQLIVEAMFDTEIGSNVCWVVSFINRNVFLVPIAQVYGYGQYLFSSLASGYLLLLLLLSLVAL